MRKIGLISRCDRHEIVSLVEKIVNRLKSRVEVLIDPKTAQKLHLAGTEMADMKKNGAEFIISIGGDGTVLRGIQKMDDPLPNLGINMGTIGFLVDVNPNDALEAIDKAL